MRLTVKTFDELSARELYEILRSRAEVFIAEQKITCCDPDGVDHDSLHCFFEDGERVVAYLRAFKIASGAARIGRVLILKSKRGTGLGKELMEKSIPEISARFACNKITVDSQIHAMGFYEKLGFVADSDEFIEEGIPHIKMLLRIAQYP